ncbi:MAG: EAL domain-containing protein [Acidovorax sp.]
MNHRLSPRWRTGLQALLAVLLSAAMLGLTFLSWHSEDRAARERERQNFNLAVEQITSSLRDRMATYEIVLRGIQGYFDGSEYVSAAEFSAYMRALKLEATHPGLVSVSLVAHVPARERATHEAHMRASGLAGYRVHPIGRQGEAYAPLTHIEPWNERLRPVLGFDLNTIPAAREAMARSAATGQSVLSRGYVLAQDEGTAHGQDLSLVLYVPLYTNGTGPAGLRGWASVPFRVQDIVHSLAHEFDPDVALSIYDGPDAAPAQRLFSTDAALAPGAVTAIRRLDVGGRAWTLAMWPKAAFTQRVDHRRSTVVAVLGVALSLAVGWFAWGLMTARNRAMRLAERMTRELRGARDELENTLSAIPDLLFELSREGRLLRHRSTREDLLHSPPEDFLGRLLSEVVPPEAARAYMGAIEHAERDGSTRGWQFPLRVADGSTHWFELSVARKQGEQPGGETTFIALSRDITERKEAESRTHHLAYYDALTGLPNRRMLVEQAQHALVHAQRNGRIGALFFIDLDHFKRINDAQGHAAGDALLVQVARRLQDLLRPEDLAGRLGGDEFVVLAQDLGTDPHTARRAAESLATRLREALDSPYALQGSPYSSAGSIGATLFPRGQTDAQDLLREADTAMYQAKAGGRNRTAFYEPEMQLRAQQELSLAQDLQRAWDLGQFAVYAQSQVDGAGRIVGGELLLRWFHPERGVVPPERFIPLAEESGLILRLGEWVLEQACTTLAALSATHPEIRLAVNMSQRQFLQDDFVEGMAALLERTGAPAERLVLEVTESLLIATADDTVRRMAQLVKLGLRFAIDDFGTGYSSFAYLKRLPLYELKIDKSFVKDTPGSPSDTAIVQSILAVARHLGLAVVAEGVETEAQAAFLAANYCQSMQGHRFGRPMPLAQWLRELPGGQEDATDSIAGSA